MNTWPIHLILHPIIWIYFSPRFNVKMFYVPKLFMLLRGNLSTKYKSVKAKYINYGRTD